MTVKELGDVKETGLLLVTGRGGVSGVVGEGNREPVEEADREPFFFFWVFFLLMKLRHPQSIIITTTI